MKDVLHLSREFIYRNARPLDLARWRFHFDKGSQEDVLTALSHYQNEDGGFGHGLEPDAWNPYSSPIQTWTATEILREINFTQSSHPLIKGILRYLESGEDFDGHHWLNTIKSNNDYPHAPWWHTQSESTSHHRYNPGACLAGFIVRYAHKGSPLCALGCRIAGEAFYAYIDQGMLDDMHTALCYVRLMQYVQEAEAFDLFDTEALLDKLIRQVHHSITHDPAVWETSYCCKPSQFIGSANSVFYAGNKDAADYECEHIPKTQLEDGSWPVTWAWSGYPEAWAISRNWWKSNGILKYMLYLKGFGMI